MQSHRPALTGITIVGGTAVLLSYVYGFVAHPDEVGLLWGGVPEQWRGLYTTSMFPAALGFFPMTFFLFFRTELDRKLLGRMELGSLLKALYFTILVASTLWMPMTFAYIAQPSAALWAGVCIDLALVGLASLAIILLLLRLRPETTSIAWWLAVLGSLFFAFQTAVLDACLWPTLFVLP